MTGVSPPQAGLTRMRRTLRSWDVVILTLSGLSPAASVYITGAGVLHMAGTGAAAALMLGGVVAVVASLLCAELGAAFPNAGGIYPSIAGVLGRGPAFVTIALGLVAAPASLAFVALGLADYLRVFAPALPKLPVAFTALGGAVLLATLNIRINAWITGVFLATESLSLIVLTVLAGGHPVRGLGEVLLHPQMLGEHHRLLATPFWIMVLATLSGAFACSGSSLAIYFAEEIRGAPRRIGWVVALVGVVGAVVVGVPLVLLTTSVPDLAGSLSAEAPIAHYLKEVAGPAVAYAVTLAVALAILNNVIANMLAFSRFLYATGRDGVWPKPIGLRLSSLHRRFGSPWVASLALGCIGCGLCFVGERGLLVILSGDVFTAAMVVAAVLVGRRRGQTGVTSFRSPLFPLTPLLGLVVVAAVVAADWHDRQAGRPSLVLLSGVAVCALAYSKFRGLLRRFKPELR